MSSFQIRSLCCLLSLFHILACSVVGAAEINGAAKDYTDGTKLVKGAWVSVCDGAKLVQGTNSPTKGPIQAVDGHYKFDSVGAGSYVVHFEATGYDTDDKDVVIQAPDVKQIDGELLKRGAPVGYYAMAGASFVSLVKKDGGTAAAYKARWQQLRRIGPAPAAKIEIVRGIVNRDPNAREQLPYAQYLDLKSMDIEKIAEPFNRALNSNARMPTRGFAGNVGDEVIADVVLHEVRESKADVKAKARFVEQFGAEWNGSKAAKIVTSAYDVSHTSTLDNPK